MKKQSQTAQALQNLDTASSNAVSDISEEKGGANDAPKTNSAHDATTVRPSTKRKSTTASTKAPSTKRTTTVGGAKKKTGQSAASKKTSAKDTSKSRAAVKNATKKNGGWGETDDSDSDSDNSGIAIITKKAPLRGTGLGAAAGGKGVSKGRGSRKERLEKDGSDFDVFNDNNENTDPNRPMPSGVIDEIRKKSKEIKDNKLRSDMLEGTASVAAVRATFGTAEAKEYEEYLKLKTTS